MAFSQYYQIERDLVTGLVILASLVLLRTMFTRRRRLFISSHPVYRDTGEDDDLEVTDHVIQQNFGIFIAPILEKKNEVDNISYARYKDDPKTRDQILLDELAYLKRFE